MLICIVSFGYHFLPFSRNRPQPVTNRPHRFAKPLTIAVFAAVCLTAAGPVFCQEPSEKIANSEPVKAAVADAKKGFQPLQGHWKAASFGGDGAVEFKKLDGGAESIEMFAGDPITGIRWTGDFPKENYELRLQARRVEGFDFFAAVTFPVADEHCSFVLGGWGGGMVGISSIDGDDASSNDTTQYKEFETNQWYTIRVRVDQQAIRCWIDEHEFATVPRDNHSFSIRIEMDPCLPVGIANYMTRSEIKNIAWRKITADESNEPESPVKEVATKESSK